MCEKVKKYRNDDFLCENVRMKGANCTKVSTSCSANKFESYSTFTSSLIELFVLCGGSELVKCIRNIERTNQSLTLEN